MKFSAKPVLFLALASTAFAFPKPSSGNRAKAEAVKKVFRTAWQGYHDHAFPNDTLHPVTNIGESDRNGWGATAIDALSTAILMQEVDIVHQILDFVQTIDFTTTKEVNSSISIFETNIRYLGGLISGYDLLTETRLVTNKAKVNKLLKQAVVLADTLAFAFDTPTGIPINTVYLNPKPRQANETTNAIATFGTLVLEWTRLSDLTGNKKYARLAQKAESYILHPTGSPEPFPGLVGESVSVKTGEFVDSKGAWSGGTDSAYEYLIKMYLYDPKEFSVYKDRWVLAADSSMKYLASHPTSRKDLTFLSQYDGPIVDSNSGHLASFAGGNFILGGILLGERKYIDFGITLAESYFATYSTPSGIGPEGFRWVSSTLPTNGSSNALPPPEDAEFYEKAGFWVQYADYVLRPETIESLWYSYRVTGHKRYQDQVWEAFTTIRDRTRVGSGYSGLKDVGKVDGGGYDDFMQSFFLAETLKYSYLAFAPESDLQLKAAGHNKWVFNTEAHPFKVRGHKASYV